MRNEREKKIVLSRISVAIIMVALVVLWILNSRNLLATSPKENNSDKRRSAEIEQLKEDFARELIGAKDKLEKARVRAEREQAGKLMDDLERRAFDFATSSALMATTTATATGSAPYIASSSSPGLPYANKTKCPEYIDCMPSIGAPKDCRIPEGCEAITQIAY